MTKRALATAIALVVGGILGSPIAEARHPDRLECLPISTCGDPATSPDAEECPAGSSCVCVPSCPLCDDCPVQVCVPVQIACHSACECPDGMGCREGYCVEGAEPTHCCDSEDCPAGEKCQDRQGNIDVCERECRTACDCAPGLGCFDGQCIAGVAPVYCCESDECPAGEQCQSGRTGEMGRCEPERECRTACDCEPGLGCFDGQCIAGFAPVFCCEGDVCPAGQQCQHETGRMDRCERDCVEHAWLCNDDDPTGLRGCREGRECKCTASCPLCEDCGPNACVTPDTPTPYSCNDDGSCARDGDKCICLSSCPACDDCAKQVCVPSCEDDPMCRKRLTMSQRRINRVIDKANSCNTNDQCVRVETSTGCQGTCGAYVNRRYARRVQNFINHVDERYCTGYQEAGCPFSTPACQQTVGACIQGKCKGVPGPIIGPGPVIGPRPQPVDVRSQ